MKADNVVKTPSVTFGLNGFITNSHIENINGKEITVVDSFDLRSVSIVSEYMETSGFDKEAPKN